MCQWQLPKLLDQRGTMNQFAYVEQSINNLPTTSASNHLLTLRQHLPIKPAPRSASHLLRGPVLGPSWAHAADAGGS